MQEKFNQFFNTWNGKYAEAEDPNNLYQCFDLVFLWCDALNIPREAIRHQFARQIWEEPTDVTKQYFNLIPNSAFNSPKVGDIIVFNTKVGPAGHTSIETGKSNFLNLTSFDQNYGWPTYCRQVSHNLYYGVYGWLSPKPDKLIPSSTLLSILNGAGSDGDKLISIKKLCV